MSKKEHKEIAKEIMDTVACSNGWVNRWNPMKYNKHWLNKIAKSAGVFFDDNPELLNNENILLMCDGETEEVNQKFGHIDSYKNLSACIEGYFSRGEQ